MVFVAISLISLVVIIAPALGAVEKELVPGTTLQETSTPGISMFYRFTVAPNKTHSLFETMIVRVVRSTRFTEDTDVIAICLSTEKLPDCSSSGEKFEVWIDYALLRPSVTYTVGIFTNAQFDFNLEACITKCTDSCPTDCNGNGGCAVGGFCQCDQTRDALWSGKDCGTKVRLIATLTVPKFVVLMIFAVIGVILLPALWMGFCDVNLRTGKKAKMKYETLP